MAVKKPYGLRSPYATSYGGSTPAANPWYKPVVPKAPPAPPAPRAPGTGGVNAAPAAAPAAPTPPTVDPRDPTYWNDLARSGYERDTGIYGYESQLGDAGLARDRALQDLAKGNAESGRTLREQMASRGLGVSGVSAQALGNLTDTYNTNVNRQNESYANLENRIRGQGGLEDQLRTGYTINADTARVNAGQRAAAMLAQQAATGAPEGQVKPGTYKLTDQQRIALTLILNRGKASAAHVKSIREQLAGLSPYIG
jgi:hypothetical protein